MAHILHVDPLHPERTPDPIREAAALIQSGALVAFPTETVYGLGANAYDAVAVGRIFAAKKRPTSDPVIVHVSTPEQVDQVAASVSPVARQLMKAFWPGALTLILPRGERIPPNVSAGLPSVGVRMPAHPVALALIQAAGVPIAAPSANLFSHTSPTSAHHVWRDLGDSIPLILDGGAAPIGVESTILDLTGERPQLLRPGGVPLEAIQRIIPAVKIEVVERYAAADQEALPAPGMLLRHYAPRASLHLYEGPDRAVRSSLAAALDRLRRETPQARIGLLLADEDLPALGHHTHDPQVVILALGSLHDLSEAARRLYAALHDLDEQQVDLILARSFPAVGIGAALRDRLTRAAEGKVVQVQESSSHHE